MVDQNHNHIDRFNQLSKNYVEDLDHSLRLTGGDSQYFYNMKMRLIKKNLTKAPQTILDFGCASGQFTMMLHQEFKDSIVIGYDPARDCIDEARSRFKQGPGLTFTDQLLAIQAKPDLVVATGVFHHIPPAERQKVSDQIFQITTPGSRFFIFEHNPWNPITRLIVKNAPVDQGAILVRPKQGLDLIKSSGFNSCRIQYIGFVPPVLKRLLPLESFLSWLPIGAQFMLIGDR